MTAELFNTLSFFSPIIIATSVLIFSIFTSVIGKGVFYLFWILIATFVRIGILWLIPGSSVSPKYENKVCEMGNFLPYDNSAYSTYILMFTFFYFTMPMYISNNTNYLVVLFFIIYIVFDILVKLTNGCILHTTSLFGDIIGGGGLGAAIAALIYFSPIQSYLFVNELNSNKEMCSMSSKQTFRCSVYKNGELISSSTT